MYRIRHGSDLLPGQHNGAEDRDPDDVIARWNAEVTAAFSSAVFVSVLVLVGHFLPFVRAKLAWAPTPRNRHGTPVIWPFHTATQALVQLETRAFAGRVLKGYRPKVAVSASPRSSGADAFTETVTKGDKKLYRARFAGLDRDEAEAACKYLKRNEIACMTIKN